MKIHELHLSNFRGFEKQEFRFHDQLTLVVGKNGTGKTCLLEGLCVAVGGWLYGFDGLEGADKRNFIKDDCRKIAAKVNNALLEQYPVRVDCTATLPTGVCVQWGRCLSGANGKTTIGELTALRELSEEYNKKIHNGNDEDVILPLVVYYSSARLWNEPIQKKRTIERDKIRLVGYKKAVSSFNSIKDAFNFIDKIAYSAYREDDQDSLVKMKAIIGAIQTSLESVSPASVVYYDLKSHEFRVKHACGEIKSYKLLSDGYRGITSMIIDICHRIMALNPQLGESAIRETSGVVLIDEIDLHIHPQWQQRVLGDLTKIFPKLQFIVTTHAPSVIQSVKSENLMILGGDSPYYYSRGVYGRDVNSVLTDVMDVRTRPIEIEERFSFIHNLIADGKLEEATKETDKLEQVIGNDDPEITGIRITIDLESLEV
jgi:predicted ATP-binding protein involved in virulence